MSGAYRGSRGAIRPVPATPAGGSSLAGWLLTIAAVLLPVLLVAQWVDDLVVDRGQYEAVASTLAGGGLADAVTTRVCDDVVARLALEKAPPNRLAALATTLGLPPAVRADAARQRARIVSAARSQVWSHVEKAVVEPAAADQWAAAAVAARGRVVGVVRASSDGQAQSLAREVTLRVDVQRLLADERPALARLGLDPRSPLPPVTLSLASADPDRLSQARWAFRVANDARRVLPIVCVVLAGAGVALARRKWRAIAVACLLGAVPLLAAWGAVRAGREAAPDVRSGSAFFDALIPAVAGPAADPLTDSFRVALLALAGVGVAAMLLAGSVGRLGSSSWMPPVVGYVPPRPRPGARPDGRGPASTARPRPGAGQRSGSTVRSGQRGQSGQRPGAPSGTRSRSGARSGAPQRPGTGRPGQGAPSAAGSQAARTLAQLAERLAATGNRPPSGIVPGGPARRRPER